MFAYDLLGSHLRGEIDSGHIEAFMEGMKIGMEAKEDVAFQKYEIMLSRDLDDLREEFNIKIDNEIKPWRNYLGKLDPAFENVA